LLPLLWLQVAVRRVLSAFASLKREADLGPLMTAEEVVQGLRVLHQSVVAEQAQEESEGCEKSEESEELVQGLRMLHQNVLAEQAQEEGKRMRRKGGRRRMGRKGGEEEEERRGGRGE